MSDFREEEALGKIYDSHLARRLFGYLRPYKGWVAIAALLTMVTGYDYLRAGLPHMTEERPRRRLRRLRGIKSIKPDRVL